jgi:hypothetical protein
MRSVIQFIELAGDCVEQYRDAFAGKFAVTIVAAVLLGALGWFVCAKWTYLWNKAFHARRFHHLLCGLVAVMTFFFVVLYPSLGMLEGVASAYINHWANMLSVAGGETDTLSAPDLRRAKEWNAETFLTARHFVLAAQKKNENGKKFSQADWQSKYALPSTGPQSVAALEALAQKKRWILDPDETHIANPRPMLIPGDNGGILHQKMAEVYANAAISLFNERYPLLSRLILPPEITVSQTLIQRDMAASKDKVYNLENATNIARKQMNEELGREVPRVVTAARRWLVGLFLVAQAIPFGLIGWAAYEDLTAHRKQRSGRIPRCIPSRTRR